MKRFTLLAFSLVSAFGQSESPIRASLTRASLQTAIDSLPTTGGIIYVPRGTIAFGTTQVTVAVSHNKTQILCEPGAIFTYTGTGAAFQVGDDLANTEYFRMEGCEINISGNTNATAMGLKLIRSFWGNVKDVKIISNNGGGAATQTALMVSGGDGCAGAPGCGSPSQAGFSAYNKFENVAIIGSWLKGFHFASEISGGPASRDRSNRNLILGGSVYSGTAAFPYTGTIGVHFEHGDTNWVLNTDLDSVSEGVRSDGHNNHISAKCEGPTVQTYCVHVGSTSQGTYIEGVNPATGKFFDEGFETQYILASQNGENQALLSNVAARYSMKFVPRAGDPSPIADGMMWYDFNVLSAPFKVRENGVTRTLQTKYTFPERIVYPAAICRNATATVFFHTPVSNPVTAACVTGTNTQQAVLQFTDGSNLSFQHHFQLPSDWTGAIDVAGKWRTSATTGNVVWQIQTVCISDSETADPAFNAVGGNDAVAEPAKGTTLQFNDFNLTNITTTGCAAGEEFYFKFFRDSAHASDNLAATAELINITFTVRRTLW